MTANHRWRSCTQAQAGTAAYGLLWNNPKLHMPDRRKTWLACEEHADPLSDYLSSRGFLKDAVPVSELGAAKVTDEVG